ncbi:hypothetical protein L7F22_009783 [Adiantum nelumboides]|nr:hypothetical protein [Adiantum nelumboides]
MENVLKAGCPGKDIEDITVEDFKMMAMKHGHKLKDSAPKTWTFGGYERDAEGRFDDQALAELLYDCVEEPAHAFGARGTPASLKVIEILSQLQARKYLNLKPFSTFKEWNSDPEIADAAEALYGHPDALELYPGLMAEEAKPTMPGESTYALLPFYTPKAIRSILHKNKKLDKYDTDRPKVGLKHGAAYGVKTYDGIKRVFEDRDTFRVPYEKSIKGTLGVPFMICFDDETRHNEAHKRLAAAFFEPDFQKHIKDYFTNTTQAMLKKHVLAFHNSSRRQIDVVRDVCNVVPTLWVANKVGIPIKSEETPHGLMSHAELRLSLLVLFIWFSFDGELDLGCIDIEMKMESRTIASDSLSFLLETVIPAAHYGLKEAANTMASTLTQILEARLKTNYGIKEKMHDALAKGTSYEVSPEADHLYHTLLASKLPLSALSGDILGMITPVIGNQTQQSALLVDLFLSPGYEYAKDRIIELAHKDTDEADEELKCWVREGMRHAGVVLGVPRMVSKDVTVTDGDGRSFEMKVSDNVEAYARTHSTLE